LHLVNKQSKIHVSVQQSVFQPKADKLKG